MLKDQHTFCPSFVIVSIPVSASGLLRSAFFVALNFFLGWAFGAHFADALDWIPCCDPCCFVSLENDGRGSRNMVTLGSCLNRGMCSSKGGSVPAVAATTAPVNIFASSVHNCLSALMSCSNVMRECPAGGGVFNTVNSWLIHLFWQSQLLKRTWSSASARLCKHHWSCIVEPCSASKFASGADSLRVWCSSRTTDG